MDWVPVITLFLTNIAIVIPLFIWNRSESRADIRHMDIKLESNQELVRAIHDEIRDFHMKLLEIEKKKAS